jgi:hypothetical protein
LTTPIKEVPGVIGSDEHDEAVLAVFDADGIVERVDDDLVAHTVLAGAGCDEGLIHFDKLACYDEQLQANLRER